MAPQFGYGVGDFLAVAKLALIVGLQLKQCADAPEEYRRLSTL